MTHSERLLMLIQHFTGGRKSKFAEMIGISPSTISLWISRDTYDSEQIYSKCPGVNAAWLLTGEGEMLLSEQSATPEDITDKLLNKIQAQAEEIGRLKAKLDHNND
jgi:hypothetical protein